MTNEIDENGGEVPIPRPTARPAAARMSPEIGELVAALAAAQGQFKPAIKGSTANIESTKGSYRYTFAELADCIEAVREPLSKNGLAVLQPTAMVGGEIILRTMLAHKSGQWIASEFPLPIGQADWARPQNVGSLITYFRRYTLCSLLQIAQEDDDSQAAMPREETSVMRPSPAMRQGGPTRAARETERLRDRVDRGRQREPGEEG